MCGYGQEREKIREGGIGRERREEKTEREIGRRGGDKSLYPSFCKLP
jgi:hypothetical protein